jgi:hypothetical protein
MSFTPTYFLNRIDADELSRLLSERTSFHLENVGDVNATAASFSRTLAELGLKVRIKETRLSLVQDTAVTLFPMVIGIWVLAYLAWRGMADRLRTPHPDVLVIKRRGGGVGNRV